MATQIKFKRGTRANLDTLASGGDLITGEPIYIIDEDRVAICTSTTTYETFAKESEVTTNTDHTTLTNLTWTSSGHTGTAGRIAGFDGVGAPAVFIYPTQPLIFTDIVANNWISDTTYTDYEFKCEVNIDGIVSTDVAIVTFSHENSISGNYSPICETASDAVAIYAKVNDEIIIPTIIIFK